MGSPTSTSPANPPSSPSANSPNLSASGGPSSPNSNRFTLSLVGGLIRRPRGNTLKANDRNPPSPTTASNDPLPSPPTNSTQPVGTAGGAEEGRSSYFPGLRRKGSRRLLSFGGHSNIAEASGEASGSGSGSGERNNSSAIGAGSGSPSGHHHHLFSSGRGARRSSSQPPAQQTPNHSSNSTTNTNESDMASTSSPRLTSPRTPSTHQRSHTAVHGSLPPLPAISTTQVEHSTTVNSGSGETSDRPSTGSGTDSPKRTHIRLVPHLESTRSLHFEPIERALLPGSSLKIGRFTERNSNNPNSGLGPDALTSTKVAFHSKVVSRTHAEIHLISSAADGGVTFQIKDTCSSSGTFLNHIRLSGPGLESRLFSLRDGDVVQLGVDYQGGTEEQYRCVKIRVEIGRNWQKGPNTFNANALKQLRALSVTPAKTATSKAAAPAEPAEQLTDCCICLYPITVCQALFIAPCSHTTHFKCIRPMINLHYPGFNCPLCRTFANLDADVEIDPEPVEEEHSTDDDDKAGPLTSVPPDGGMSPSFDPEAGTGTLVATSNPLPRHPIPPMPTIDPVNEEAFHQEADNRRSSIIISGANGNSVPFAITGRNRGSRPGSIRNEGASRPGSVRNGTSGGLSVAPIFPVTFDNGSPTSPIPPTGVNGNQRVPSNSNLSTHVFTNNDDDDEDGDDYVPGAGLGIRVGGGALEEGNTLVPELLQRMRDQLGIDDTMEAGTPPDHQTIYTGGGESSRGRSAALAEENKREATPGRSGGERDVF